MFGKFQKLGKAMLLPVSALPICGILMGIGYALAPGVMNNMGSKEGAAYIIGLFLIKVGGAILDNLPLLFAIGVATGLSKDNSGIAALSGAISMAIMVLVITNFSSFVSDDAVWKLAYEKIYNPFVGILAGIIAAKCYNKFSSLVLPEFLSFFSGKRSVAIITTVITMLVSLLLLLIWPFAFNLLVLLGKGLASLGPWGAGLYATLNRLLIPTGLHHALNNVFWFDTIGMGDLTAFWGGKTSADVNWSVGMYMSGFFPCMMFGIPGAAIAMIKNAKTSKRKFAIGVVGAAAFCAFLCGVTEPFEFAFMFICFPLYIIYSILYGIFTIITVLVGFRAGFSFSAGLLDLIFSASLPAAQKTLLILPLGAAAFVVFFLVFNFAIKKFNIKTIGREDDVPEEEGTPAIETKKEDGAKNSFTDKAAVILEGLGGPENIASADHCITRLRMEVKDMEKVDEAKIKSAGVAGIIKPSKTAIQIIIGTKVQFVFDELVKML